MKPELVSIPITYVDRAKAFYADKVGLNVDLDVNSDDPRVEENLRVVQLTPPGSACLICIGTRTIATPPGSVQGLHLVVEDIEASRVELTDREWTSARCRTSGEAYSTLPSAIQHEGGRGARRHAPLVPSGEVAGQDEAMSRRHGFGAVARIIDPADAVCSRYGHKPLIKEGRR